MFVLVPYKSALKLAAFAYIPTEIFLEGGGVILKILKNLVGGSILKKKSIFSVTILPPVIDSTVLSKKLLTFSQRKRERHHHLSRSASNGY